MRDKSGGEDHYCVHPPGAQQQVANSSIYPDLLRPAESRDTRLLARCLDMRRNQGRQTAVSAHRSQKCSNPGAMLQQAARHNLHATRLGRTTCRASQRIGTQVAYDRLQSRCRVGRRWGYACKEPKPGPSEGNMKFTRHAVGRPMPWAIQVRPGTCHPDIPTSR